MARCSVTRSLLCVVVCNMMVACGHSAPLTKFMQLDAQAGASQEEIHLSVQDALGRADLAVDAWSTTDRLLGHAGMTLRSGPHQTVCFVLVVVLFFSMCCLGDEEDRCCRAASLVVPLVILLYVCFGTDLLEAFYNGEKVGVWCAILCVWSFVQLLCCVPAVFCFGAALAVHESKVLTPGRAMSPRAEQRLPSKEADQQFPFQGPAIYDAAREQPFPAKAQEFPSQGPSIYDTAPEQPFPAKGSSMYDIAPEQPFSSKGPSEPVPVTASPVPVFAFRAVPTTAPVVAPPPPSYDSAPATASVMKIVPPPSYDSARPWGQPVRSVEKPRWFDTTTQPEREPRPAWMDTRAPQAPVALDTSSRPANITQEQAATLILNIVQQTGASQDSALRSLEENHWHGGLAARALKSQASP